ncbi:hypothetical protein QZH41_019450 [Actinostola sp. cb2023]|nr:hypothetical protein QZH41_019450 [Actinostola sp. cb2023]
MSLKREAENGKNGLSITEAEAELYDRQIRLWGLDAQKRLRASSILVIGMTGVGAEICKNLILSGVRSLAMLDPSLVTEEDFVSQFLIAREDLGKNRAKASLQRAKELNPMVQVTADSTDVESKPPTFFNDFDVVIATGCSSDTITKLNNICTTSSIKFYAADVFGFYGYMFADLGRHRYVE